MQYRAIITDIEGTTSSISFVHDVLFPYARRHILRFLTENCEEASISALVDEVKQIEKAPRADIAQVAAILDRWMQEDRKTGTLKEIQGRLWQSGYEKGDFLGHVFEDAWKNLKKWKEAGIALYVYSSGSVQAQKLLFGYSEFGDLTSLFSGYFDTKIGAKKERASYEAIAKSLALPPEQILFLSDSIDEIKAATAAGMRTAFVSRDNNAQDYSNAAVNFDAIEVEPSFQSLGFSYRRGTLSLLNQQKLPLEEEWIELQSPEEMVEAIHSLKVRGAPLIGIAAAFSLAQLAAHGAPLARLEEVALLLKGARPTAVNLAHAIDRVMASVRIGRSALEEAANIFWEDERLCEIISQNGADLIGPNERILTYCNTGSLATAGIGTALGVIKKAYAQGKVAHVYVPETRPLFQGARLTTWELGRLSIPYTLVCDNMVACLMAQGLIDRVFVGADRIAANGDSANKIGTYSIAVLARHHNIPFHIVAPSTTVDLQCPCGANIVIEERSKKEVLGSWSAPLTPVYNPAFDVTPAALITSYVLDKDFMFATQIKEEIVAAGQWLADLGLCPATSGNLSQRIVGSKLFAISCSGKHKGELSQEDILLIDSDGKSLDSRKKPSAETAVHLCIYSHFADAGAVLHTHSVHGTVLSRLIPGSLLETEGYEMHKVFPHLKTHESKLMIPIFENTQDYAALCEELSACFKEHPNIAGFYLRGHGLYAWGRDIAEAKARVEAFEFLFSCELLFAQRQVSV